jgi:hypothetical protein
MPQSQSASTRKRCARCQRRRTLQAFARNRHCQDGRCSECRECKAKRDRTWYRRLQQETRGLYSKFIGMKQRCLNPNHDAYRYYGGRGIRICEEWLASFQSFLKWAIGQGYQPGLQIDRIDNDVGYSPQNCRFVTAAENAQNKRGR